MVLYHFGVKGFSGGFAGVDIFFVISGFLMTGIIFRQTDAGKFSLIGFYLSRAKRIIPALAVLCLALLVGGWFLLIPSDYKELGKHGASSIAFLSNMVYWKDAGYFDTASHEKWLLHTWSLSVEWQFYMVYPLIILAARKRSTSTPPGSYWLRSAWAHSHFAYTQARTTRTRLSIPSLPAPGK